MVAGVLADEHLGVVADEPARRRCTTDAALAMVDMGPPVRGG
jgi:hypothetical protein